MDIQASEKQRITILNLFFVGFFYVTFLINQEQHSYVAEQKEDLAVPGPELDSLETQQEGGGLWENPPQRGF